MEQRQTYLSLLDLINHVLKEEEVPADFDWVPVLLLANEHHLVGFVYRAAAGRKDIAPEVIEQIETAYFTAVGEQSRQEHYATLLFSILKEREIRYLPMAGFVLRGLYPQPTWRNSSDLDIAVSEEHRREVGEILDGLSFTETMTCEAYDFYALDHVAIRVHSAPDESFWESITTHDGNEYHYTDEDFYLELLSMMKRRMLGGTCGVRTILDLYIYRYAKPGMNREKIEEKLRALDLVVLEESMVQLSETWFGGMEMTDDIMLLGSYIAALGTLQDQQEEDSRGCWRTVFPRYRVMKRRYPVLNRAKVLLPFMWVARWLSLLFSRGHDRYTEELNQNTTERSIEMEKRVMEIVGLQKTT